MKKISSSICLGFLLCCATPELWHIGVFVAASSGNETDRLALIKLKESIEDSSPGSLNSWNDSLHFCEWHGVRCSPTHQRVTTINLKSFNLRATLSPYIGNLSFLRVLVLENNILYGPIPQEIGYLSRLIHLNLGNNTFAGEIPVSLSNCSELNLLSLSINQLNGKIPYEIGSLVKLQQVFLDRNNFTGIIPPWLGNLSSLVNFSVAFNSLQGKIPDELGQLRNLSRFYAARNSLSGPIPPSLYNVSSLTVFSTASNQLSGILPSSIGFDLPNLRQFGIGDNQFSGTIPLSVTNASRLEIFQITSNIFHGQVPTALGNLQRLTWLGLSVNHFGSNSSGDLDFLLSLPNCTQLSQLEVHTNNFGGALPNAISNLSTELVSLTLESNQIYGMIPENINNLFNLAALGLRDNLLSGVIPTSFANFPQIRVMFLSQNKLSGGISFVGNLTQMAELSLYQNSLEGSIPTSIGNCKSLQALDLAENMFNGTIPDQFFALTSLSRLVNLSNNLFSGPLPASVGNLDNLRTLDIADNNFSGEIPSTIGDISNLEYLYMQGNSFRGMIPTALTSLEALKRFDLSRNNLSGEIPQLLSEIPSLKYINLSANDLEGEVPSEGIFKNISAIYVAGNNKLCGGVPDLHLPGCTKNKNQNQDKSLLLKLIIIMVPTFLGIVLVLGCLLVIYKVKYSKKSASEIQDVDKILKVSYKMLHLATNGFSSNNLIGSGGFGSVYKGSFIEQNERMVAIKVLNLQQRGASKSFMAECKVLKNIRHRNLVKMLTYCSSLDYKGNDFKALVFEFMANSSLDKWLHSENQSTKNLGFPQQLNIIFDVASALHYLHDHCETPIVHCDLKPSNVLLDNDMVAHLGDFGLARLLLSHDQPTTTSTIGMRGSIGYSAPEYGMGGEASKEGDVYSFGVLMLEMLTGIRPTDEISMENLSLHDFVKEALPERFMHVVNPILITREKEEGSSNYSERQMILVVQKCLLSMLQIGVTCSSLSPGERMSMDDVDRELKLINKQFLDAS